MNFDDLNTLLAAGGVSLYICLMLWWGDGQRDDVVARAPARRDAATRARRKDPRH